jgi:hypothetical protein
MIVTCPNYVKYQEEQTAACLVVFLGCEIPPRHLRPQPPLFRIQISSPSLRSHAPTSDLVLSEEHLFSCSIMHLLDAYYLPH